jgi:hypothetical protein
VIIALDAVIDGVGGVQFEIFFEIAGAEVAELGHAGEISSKRPARNFLPIKDRERRIRTFSRKGAKAQRSDKGKWFCFLAIEETAATKPLTLLAAPMI